MTDHILVCLCCPGFFKIYCLFWLNHMFFVFFFHQKCIQKIFNWQKHNDLKNKLMPGTIEYILRSVMKINFEQINPTHHQWPWRPGFNPWSSHTKDSKNGTWCLLA